MRIPVILVTPGDGHLRAKAIEARSNFAAGIDLASAPSYPNVELDPTFSPVPLGAAEPGAVAMAAEESKYFVVRGHISVDSPDSLPRTAGEASVYADPQIRPMLTCGGSPPVGNAANVATLLNAPALQAKGLTGAGVAVAIVDTGINLAYLSRQLGHAPALDANASWRPPGTPPPDPGSWPVNHGTMCAYDALIAAPAATLIDVPVLSAHFPGGGSIMSGTLSAAIAAFGFLMTSWQTGPLRQRYKALVASNSWGIFHPSWDFPAAHPGRYCDNPLHPFNLQVGSAVRAGIDVVFAAGNCGAPCADGRCQGRTIGSIMGASAMQDVLTIAGCDTNNQRVGYSSQGPSIGGMYLRKPDVTSYTHFLGSEAFGSGLPDSGTSAACPVAAGCIAALRTAVPPTALSPAMLFTTLRTTAFPTGGMPPGWNRDYGYGIVDLTAAAVKLGIFP